MSKVSYQSLRTILFSSLYYKTTILCTCNFAPFTKWNRGQKECPVIQGDLPGNSSDNDICYEHTRQQWGGKYLRESYYHRIECFAANSLATLMRKWYLISSFQPYSYSPETSGRCWCDRDQPQQSNLHVEGRDEDKGIV